jgi:hypothetical protein
VYVLLHNLKQDYVFTEKGKIHPEKPEKLSGRHGS